MEEKQNSKNQNEVFDSHENNDDDMEISLLPPVVYFCERLEDMREYEVCAQHNIIILVV